VTALARFATVAKAQAVARLPEERRTATLLAFVRTLEASAQDDVLDLFDIVVSKLFTDAVALPLGRRIAAVVLSSAVWSEIFARPYSQLCGRK
jgi:hypothetical protein